MAMTQRGLSFQLGLHVLSRPNGCLRFWLGRTVWAVPARAAEMQLCEDQPTTGGHDDIGP